MVRTHWESYYFPGFLHQADASSRDRRQRLGTPRQQPSGRDCCPTGAKEDAMLLQIHPEQEPADRPAWGLAGGCPGSGGVSWSMS